MKFFLTLALEIKVFIFLYSQISIKFVLTFQISQIISKFSITFHHSAPFWVFQFWIFFNCLIFNEKEDFRCIVQFQDLNLSELYNCINIWQNWLHFENHLIYKIKRWYDIKFSMRIHSANIIIIFEIYAVLRVNE